MGFDSLGEVNMGALKTGTKCRACLCVCVSLFQLLRSSLVNNRTQAKVAEELGMQEYAITNDKTKRPVALRTKTLADLLECECVSVCVYWVS